MASKKDEIPMYDYSALQEDTVDSTDVLGKISKLADEMHQLDKDIASKKLELKKLESQRRGIAEEQLPELFMSVGQTELRTTSGLPLKLTNKVFTNISKDRKPVAIKWLDDNGQGGMVKRRVIIEFNKTQAEKVEKLLKLIGRGWPNHSVDLDVHGSTVKSFVTKRLNAGEEVPLDIFGVHCVDVVEIKSKK